MFTLSKEVPPKAPPAQLVAKTSPAGKAPVSAADQAQGGGGAPGGGTNKFLLTNILL